MNKITQWLVFASLMLSFVACKVNIEEYQSSPKVNIVGGVLPNKTISIYYDKSTGVAITDTLQLGDTLRLMFRLNAFGFQLKRFHIEKPQSFALVDVLSPDSIARIVSADSNLSELDFYFLSNISYVALPINYIPARASKTDSIVLHLQSDITSKQNHAKQVLRIPVRAKQK